MKVERALECAVMAAEDKNPWAEALKALATEVKRLREQPRPRGMESDGVPLESNQKGEVPRDGKRYRVFFRSHVVCWEGGPNVWNIETLSADDGAPYALNCDGWLPEPDTCWLCNDKRTLNAPDGPYECTECEPTPSSGDRPMCPGYNGCPLPPVTQPDGSVGCSVCGHSFEDEPTPSTSAEGGVMVSKYGAGSDGCEWEPSENRLAWDNDLHHHEAQATVMLGAGKNLHRLCESCSRLPRFARLRKRRQIEPRDCPAPSRQPHARHEWYTIGVHTSDTYCRACGLVKPTEQPTGLRGGG